MGSRIKRPATQQYNLPATGNIASPISLVQVDEHWQIWAFLGKNCSVVLEPEVILCKIVSSKLLDFAKSCLALQSPHSNESCPRDALCFGCACILSSRQGLLFTYNACVIICHSLMLRNVPCSTWHNLQYSTWTKREARSSPYTVWPDAFEYSHGQAPLP